MPIGGPWFSEGFDGGAVAQRDSLFGRPRLSDPNTLPTPWRTSPANDGKPTGDILMRRLLFMRGVVRLKA